jgi:hypothetical protein
MAKVVGAGSWRLEKGKEARENPRVEKGGKTQGWKSPGKGTQRTACQGIQHGRNANEAVRATAGSSQHHEQQPA